MLSMHCCKMFQLKGSSLIIFLTIVISVYESNCTSQNTVPFTMLNGTNNLSGNTSVACGSFFCNQSEACVNATCVPCEDICNTTHWEVTSHCFQICKEKTLWYEITPFELRTRLIAGFVASAASVVIMILIGYCFQKLESKLVETPDTEVELEERTYIDDKNRDTIEDRPGVRPMKTLP